MVFSGLYGEEINRGRPNRKLRAEKLRKSLASKDVEKDRIPLRNARV